MVSTDGVAGLRQDPTRTTTLRNKFASRLRRHYAEISAEINKLIVKYDIFGLTLTTNNFEDDLNDDPDKVYDDFLLSVDQTISQWSLLPIEEKLKEFNDWLKKKLDDDSIRITSDGHVTEGYKKGTERAINALLSGLETPEEKADIRALIHMQGKVTTEKLAIVKTQTYQNIKNVSETVRTKVSDQVAMGLIRGESPRTIAKNITAVTNKIGKNRATTIARTEIIRAHAEGALDRMEAMGVTHVGVEVEWSTAKDARVCPKCAPMEGVVMPISKAHGMFPLHPNCRCTPIPAFTAVNKVKLKRAINASLSGGLAMAATKKRTKSKKKSTSDWPGQAMREFINT